MSDENKHNPRKYVAFYIQYHLCEPKGWINKIYGEFKKATSSRLKNYFLDRLIESKEDDEIELIKNFFPITVDSDKEDHDFLRSRCIPIEQFICVSRKIPKPHTLNFIKDWLKIKLPDTNELVEFYYKHSQEATLEIQQSQGKDSKKENHEIVDRKNKKTEGNKYSEKKRQVEFKESSKNTKGKYKAKKVNNITWKNPIKPEKLDSKTPIPIKGLNQDTIIESNEIVSLMMTYNYLKKKFPDEDRLRNWTKELTHIQNPHSRSDKPFLLHVDKIVAVVGAGMSLEAGLPLAQDAIDMIKSELIEKGIVTEKILEDKIKRERDLRETDPEKDTDFETFMEALDDIPESRELLIKLYSPRYNPNLSCEILAHLLKHKVIDVVINFNFDELLDQAIEDEFVQEEYLRIIAGNDLHEYEKTVNANNERKPIYIKPHGTISDSESLKITRREYIELVGKKVMNIIEDCICGNTLFLFIGYNMQSPEFNKVLEKKLNEKLERKANRLESDVGDDKYHSAPRYHFAYINSHIPVPELNINSHEKKLNTLPTYPPRLLSIKTKHRFETGEDLIKKLELFDIRREVKDEIISDIHANHKINLRLIRSYLEKECILPKKMSVNEKNSIIRAIRTIDYKLHNEKINKKRKITEKELDYNLQKYCNGISRDSFYKTNKYIQEAIINERGSKELSKMIEESAIRYDDKKLISVLQDSNSIISDAFIKDLEKRICSQTLKHLFYLTYENLNNTPFNNKVLKESRTSHNESPSVSLYEISRIKKHEFYTKLFGNLYIEVKETETKKEIAIDDRVIASSYFYLRTLVELLIPLVQGKSILNTRGLMMDIVGQYYKKYQFYTKSPLTLENICKDLELIQATYSREIFSIPHKIYKGLKPNEKPAARILEWLIGNKNSAHKGAFYHLIEKYKKDLERHYKMATDITEKNELYCNLQYVRKFEERITQQEHVALYELLENLSDRYAWEIGHSFQSGISLYLRKGLYRRLNSWDHLLRARLDFLHPKYDWSKLLISSDRADWIVLNDEFWGVMKRRIAKKQKTEILLIIKYGPLAEDFEKRFEKRLDRLRREFEMEKDECIEGVKNENEKQICEDEYKNKVSYLPTLDVRFLSWWDHNRNLTIIIKEERDNSDKNIINEIPIAATYYYRGSDSQTVSPILMDSRKDSMIENEIIQELKYFQMHFYAYWLKASSKEKVELDFGEEYEVEDKIKEIKNKIKEVDEKKN